MNLKTKSRYFTLPKTSTSVELLGKPLWIAGNIFMEHYQNLSLTDIEGEVWKETKKFPKYHISNFGRIKSTVNNPKILKQRLNDNGYPTISLGLYKKSQRVHRLVAMEFIHNPLNKPEVNHKDCIKHNNHVSNLEWMYGDENYYHAVENGKCSISQGGKSVFKEPNKVFAYLKDGTLVRRYKNYDKAAEELGFSSSFIRNHAIVNASIFGLVMSDKPLYEMPKGEIKHRIPKNYIKKDPSQRDYWTNRPKKSVVVTNLLTGEETFFERAKEAQDKYKLSIPSLMKKKKNVGIRGNLHFRYANQI